MDMLQAGLHTSGKQLLVWTMKNAPNMCPTPNLCKPGVWKLQTGMAEQADPGPAGLEVKNQPTVSDTGSARPLPSVATTEHQGQSDFLFLSFFLFLFVQEKKRILNKDICKSLIS